MRAKLGRRYEPNRHYPRAFCTLPSFARIKRPRWPVELNDRHLRSHGKIGDCEQSTAFQAPNCLDSGTNLFSDEQTKGTHQAVTSTSEQKSGVNGGMQIRRSVPFLPNSSIRQYFCSNHIRRPLSGNRSVKVPRLIGKIKRKFCANNEEGNILDDYNTVQFHNSLNELHWKKQII